MRTRFEDENSDRYLGAGCACPNGGRQWLSDTLTRHVRDTTTPVRGSNSIHHHLFPQLVSPVSSCIVCALLHLRLHSASNVALKLDSNRLFRMAAPRTIVIPAVKKHAATIICVHGLGDR